MEILQAQTCCKARLDWPGGSSLGPSYPKTIQDSSETLWDLGVKGGPPFACKFHLNNCGSSAHRNPCCSKSNSSYFVKNAARNLPKRFGQVFGEVTSWTNQGVREGGTQVASEGVCKWLHVVAHCTLHSLHMNAIERASFQNTGPWGDQIQLSGCITPRWRRRPQWRQLQVDDANGPHLRRPWWSRCVQSPAAFGGVW